MRFFRPSISGFTLAELLISLAILGVIATFTIPKILQIQQEQRYNSIAKEAAGTISSAFDAYKLNNTLSGSTTMGALSQYINYVQYDTSGTLVDDVPGLGSWTCSNAQPCLRLHNGAALFYMGYNFGGTATTNAIYFHLDPDGTYSGNTNGPGKSVQIFLYYNGRMTAKSGVLPGTCTSGPCNITTSSDPSWFSW